MKQLLRAVERRDPEIIVIYSIIIIVGGTEPHVANTASALQSVTVRPYLIITVKHNGPHAQ